MTDNQLLSSMNSQIRFQGQRQVEDSCLWSPGIAIWHFIDIYFQSDPLEYVGLRAISDDLFALGLLVGVLLIGGGIGLKILRWFQVYQHLTWKRSFFPFPLA